MTHRGLKMNSLTCCVSPPSAEAPAPTTLKTKLPLCSVANNPYFKFHLARHSIIPVFAFHFPKVWSRCQSSSAIRAASGAYPDRG